MNKTDLAYAAGIIDGEGSIKIFKVDAEKLNRNFDRFQLQVQVDMVNDSAINWLHNKFGGKIYDHKKRNPNHNDSKRWYIFSQKAGKFLELILPYMLVKKDNAKISIDFLKLPPKSDLKYDFYLKNKFLNRRGTLKRKKK